MTASDDNGGLVPEDLYHKSYSDLSQLQTQLSQDVVAALAREVIDRLARELSAQDVPSGTILALSNALIGEDAKAAAKLVTAHLKNGVDANTLYLNYLGPAAHMLGGWWKSDKVSFADVTVGTGRIYAIMRTLNKHLSSPPMPEGKAVYFAAVPADDHKLGVKMAADLARQDGWSVTLAMDNDHDTLIEDITCGQHSLIGLSGGGIHALPNLARLVLALRMSVPNALILVSGNIVNVSADAIALMHVDAVGANYDDAMQKLEDLWNQLQSRRRQ